MSHLFPSLRNYQRDWVRRDVVAGLTVWAVLVPSALAYATIAGVPPVVGLYAAPAAVVLYAALGSWHADASEDRAPRLPLGLPLPQRRERVG